MTSRAIVSGFCPMGCGATLRYMPFREIRCSNRDCPRPGAVTELLADQETEHIVRIDEDGWTIRHPLWERLDDKLMTCEAHSAVAAAWDMHEPDFRYRVAGDDWERLPE